MEIEFREGGLHLPRLGLWLDPHDPCAGPELVFVSHAHSDHVAAHREVILSAPTAKLMQARVPGTRLEHVLPFGETRAFQHHGASFRLTLLPAGHIFGSAMSLIETDGGSLLYTGDFKLRRGLSAEPCEPRPADILIMETTFGRPQYTFPPTAEVLKGVARFCREALDNEETPVLLGYSLGKSQELLCGLADAGMPLMLHGSIHKLTHIYEQFGQCFPKYEPYDAAMARGKILLCPPHVVNSAMLRKLGKVRTAILTGWAVDPNCRYRYQSDAAFPLSDHADFPDLIEMVKRVQPRKVYTLHGFAADFAQTLRDLGFDAQALSQDEQFALALGGEAPKTAIANRRAEQPPAAPPEKPAAINLPPATDSFLRFAETCARIGADTRKLEKIRVLAEYLRALKGAAEGQGREGVPHPDPLPIGWGEGEGEPKAESPRAERRPKGEIRSPKAVTPTLSVGRGEAEGTPHLDPLRVGRGEGEGGKTPWSESIALAATWFSGRPFPVSQNKVLQLGWAVLRNALCAVTQVTEAEFHQVYLKHSDLGETAYELLQHVQVAPALSIQQVSDLFQQLQAARGPLAKTPVLQTALGRCTPLEAKYLVKIITGDLRIGLKEGLVEEAIAAAFSRPAEQVRQANLLLGDIGEAARLAAEDRLTQAALVAFRPIKFMLASPEPTAADVWERMHSEEEKQEARSADEGVPEQEERKDGDAVERVPTGNGRTPGTDPVWLEDKYDGVRCQLHKVGARVALYSRDLKEITTTFQELADAVRPLGADLVLDGEIVAMRGEEVLAFAELQKRLGRRQGDLFMREDVPIQFVAFDLLWLDGASLLDRPLRERRRELEALKPLAGCFRLARITQANSAAEIDAAFEAARARGNEGLMIKDPASIYMPGRRGLAWLKLKKAFATLDCVVVGAEYGHGKRSKVLSDYTFAVRDEQSGQLKTIGKAYSGLTDAEIAGLTAHFLKTATRQQGRFFEVPPDTVLEIAFDKIQPSERHASGLALRFPRIVRIRTDKTVAEIDTVASARKLAKT